MVFINKQSIINKNKIEVLHNEWCAKNGYKVRWTIPKAGRPILKGTNGKTKVDV